MTPEEADRLDDVLIEHIPALAKLIERLEQAHPSERCGLRKAWRAARHELFQALEQEAAR